VAFTPEESAAAPTGVVIDVIRATSTICQALASGYERVLCAAEVEEALSLANGDGSVTLGGERLGVRIDGFDLGNSPREYLEPRSPVLGMSTTNGTRAIVTAAARCDRVLVASLMNLNAVVGAAQGAGEDVAVFCAGVKGAFALDDAYVAGRIAELLDGERSDAAEAAVRRGSRLEHRVLTAHVVSRRGPIEALFHPRDDVEIGHRRLDHDDVGTFGKIGLNLAQRFLDVRRIHLVAAPVAKLRRGLRRLAERPVKRRPVFRRVRHDPDVFEPALVERLPDRRDATVHHVRRRDEIRTRHGMRERCLNQVPDGHVVENFFAIDDAAAQLQCRDLVARRDLDRVELLAARRDHRAFSRWHSSSIRHRRAWPGDPA
jgi:2-phosphosulfolactate phosphatase